MKLSIGIVGLPNVGKSTLFKVLTKQAVHIANYPFATIDPNVGVVPVPDERLDALAAVSNSKKKVPAVVEFYDIAGLVKGANTGEGLGNQFLSHIRDTQAIVIVLRIFNNPEIIHVENSVDPLRDMDIINTELILKDLESVTKRLDKAEAEVLTGAKDAIKTRDDLRILKAHLDTGKLPIASEEITSLIRANRKIAELNLLTAKRQLYLLNGKESEAPPELLEKIKELGAEYVITDLAADDSIPTLIKKAYDVLGLISFFTTGEDETRAWTIERGTKAPQASGVIHTDFEAKFIRAEVVNWKKILEGAAHSTGSTNSPQASSGQANTWNQAKQKGLIRLEGKEYVVEDGDVLVVRHG